MKAIVCGGRDYHDVYRICRILDAAVERLGLSAIVEGGSDGADLIARGWAKERGVPCQSFPADWQTEGRTAGPIRNRRMIHEARPDAVIAFPGGLGTADMVRQAKAAGIRVIEVHP